MLRFRHLRAEIKESENSLVERKRHVCCHLLSELMFTAILLKTACVGPLGPCHSTLCSQNGLIATAHQAALVRYCLQASYRLI